MCFVILFILKFLNLYIGYFCFFLGVVFICGIVFLERYKKKLLNISFFKDVFKCVK